MLIERAVTTQLLELSKQYPIVQITGPRQSGKTTLAKATFPNHKYINLESLDLLKQWQIIANYPASSSYIIYAGDERLQRKAGQLLTWHQIGELLAQIEICS